MFVGLLPRAQISSKKLRRPNSRFIFGTSIPCADTMPNPCKIALKRRTYRDFHAVRQSET